MGNAKKSLEGLQDDYEDDSEDDSEDASKPIKLDEESVVALEKSLMDLALHYQKDSEDKEGETKLLLTFTEQLTKSGYDKSVSKEIATKQWEGMKKHTLTKPDKDTFLVHAKHILDDLVQGEEIDATIYNTNMPKLPPPTANKPKPQQRKVQKKQ